MFFSNFKKLINKGKTFLAIRCDAYGHHCKFVGFAILLPLFICLPFFVESAEPITFQHAPNFQHSNVLVIKESLKFHEVIWPKSTGFLQQYFDCGNKGIIKGFIDIQIPFFLASPISELVISKDAEQGSTNTKKGDNDDWVFYFILLMMFFGVFYPMFFGDDDERRKRRRNKLLP